MRRYRCIILFLILGLLPVSGYAQVYRYIDENGVERFSNQPPPAGAKIIEETKEIEYDKAAGAAQDQRNRDAAAEANAKPATQPTVKPVKSSKGSTGETVIETGDGATDKKKYSRRKHRRKKEIRKEKAEMRKAMEEVEQTK